MYAHIVLIFVAILWGLNPPAMKIGLNYIPPMPYSAVRLLTALLVGALLFPRLCKWVPLRPEDKKTLFFAGISFFLFHFFFTLGLPLTTAGNAAVILGCLPVSMAVINHIHRLEVIHASAVKGIIFSFLGVILIVVGTGSVIQFSIEHIGGAVLILVAQISYGYFTVFSRKLAAVYSVYQLTVYVLFIASGLFVLLAAPSILSVAWTDVPWKGWGSALYSGIFPLCLANCLWIWGTTKAGSTMASLYFNLSPVFTIIAGYFILGESFGEIQFCGAILIVTGLYFSKKQIIKQKSKL